MQKENSEFRISKSRLEAFSDGVIAILITIMVLELKTPHGVEMAQLLELGPIFLCYVLSFIFLGIYWNNHHHLLADATHINGAIMWANLILLFFLSLVPFATAYMGENNFAVLPTAIYGVILFFSGLSYTFLAHLLIKASGENSPIAKASKDNKKGVWSILFYGVAIGLAFIQPLLSFAIYILVAAMWFIPDKNLEGLAK